MFVTLYTVHSDDCEVFSIYVNPDRVSAVKGYEKTSTGDYASLAYGYELHGTVVGQEVIYQASIIYLDGGRSLIIDMPPDEVVRKLNEALEKEKES